MTPPIRSADEAAAFLEGLINLEKQPELRYERLGLEAVRALLSRLGDPQLGAPVIHIAGSKGKGSTALFVESLLRAAGLRVGTFTSPHLERWTERFRVDGAEVQGERLAACVEILRPHVDALRAEGVHPPSFFDATTAAAFLLFRDAAVDCMVLEVGLGGRLDSTNVVIPAVTCVTQIELEHTDRLGTTLEAIAGEKAGILKPGAPCVMGPLPPEAARVVAARARETGAPLVEAGRDFLCREQTASRDGFPRFVWRSGDLEIRAELAVLGAHQVQNAALALACVQQSGLVDAATLLRSAADALKAAKLPGRIEVAGRNPWIVIDSAHTKQSARALADALGELSLGAGTRTHLVVSISADKDLESVLGALLPRVDCVTVTRAEPNRSMRAVDVARAIGALAPELACRVVPNPHLAVRAARASIGPAERLCIAGSVYLAGIARQVLSDSSTSRDSVTRSSRSPDSPDSPDSPGAPGGSPLDRI